MHNNTELGISVPMYDAITEIKEAEEILKHMNTLPMMIILNNIFIMVINHMK